MTALAEARHTSYIRGRWVHTENGGEQLYQVVEPSLPGNGDYSAYVMWSKYLAVGGWGVGLSWLLDKLPKLCELPGFHLCCNHTLIFCDGIQKVTLDKNTVTFVVA